MSQPNDFYKREDDKKWRDSTNDRITNLTASETVQNDRLDEIDADIARIDALLEGEPGNKNDTGLKGDVKDLWAAHNQLRAIMAPDQLGQGGVLNRLKALERLAGIEKQVSENRWKFWTAVTVAFITTAGFLIQKWGPEIKEVFTPKPIVVEPPKRKRITHVRVRRVPAPKPAEEENDATPTDSQ